MTLLFQSLSNQIKTLQSGAVSSEELLTAYITYIESINPHIYDNDRCPHAWKLMDYPLTS
jgi:hypothetical protein